MKFGMLRKLSVLLISAFFVCCALSFASCTISANDEHQHSYESTIIKEPTCTEEGEKLFKCVKGDDSYTEVIPALGHDYVNNVCTRCGKKEYLSILVHYAYSDGTAVAQDEDISLKEGERCVLDSTEYIAENVAFLGWFYGDEKLSADNEYAFTVEDDGEYTALFQKLTEYKLLSLPTAEETTLGTTLSDVALLGGKTTVSGKFVWTDPTAEVFFGGEYFVKFIPDEVLYLYNYQDVEYLISVPMKAQVLQTPQISIEGNAVKWGKIEGADGYMVSLNGQEIPVSKELTGYVLPTAWNEYFVCVKAVGDGVQYISSEYSSILRYVPDVPSDLGNTFGQASSVYNDDGELVRFGKTIPIDKTTNLDAGGAVQLTSEYLRILVEVDLTKFLSADAKKEIFKLNGISERMDRDLSVSVIVELVFYHPEAYILLDMDFPAVMNDLAFGISSKLVSTTVCDINLSGEFVESDNRRSTLHLLFLDLVGLEEPIYKYVDFKYRVPETLGAVSLDFSVCFDAIGAIAASLYVENIIALDYSAGIVMIADGVPVCRPFVDFNYDAQTYLSLAGEMDINVTFVRFSVGLSLNKGKESVTVLRLNLDLLELETDLSGEVTIAASENSGTNTSAESANAVVEGSYRVYSQCTFEYYLEIKLNFIVLPLDEFKIKIFDGTYVLAEHEFLKGGIPKTPYKDEALYYTTPIFATDGDGSYFKDSNGYLTYSSSNYEYAVYKNKIGAEQIVDIDDHYIYVLNEENLRRVGRTAFTERTVVSDVQRVLCSDRNYIYYVTTKDENVVAHMGKFFIAASLFAHAKKPFPQMKLSFTVSF